jgi:hypothetical protein
VDNVAKWLNLWNRTQRCLSDKDQWTTRHISVAPIKISRDGTTSAEIAPRQRSVSPEPTRGGRGIILNKVFALLSRLIDVAGLLQCTRAFKADDSISF